MNLPPDPQRPHGLTQPGPQGGANDHPLAVPRAAEPAALHSEERCGGAPVVGREQEIEGAQTRLRRRIAADPEGFFAQADADHDDHLSWDEWLQAIGTVAGVAGDDVEPAAARELFEQMKDGTLSKEEFSGWDMEKFVVGIEGEDSPSAIIARLLAAERPPDVASDLEWCGHLSLNPGRLRELLGSASFADALAHALGGQMEGVLKQAAATSDALNDKFAASGPTLDYGGREAFDAGISVWIGPPDTANTLRQMYIEHNSSEYASTEIIARNYGVKTSAKKEWVAAAGEWTHDNKSHALIQGFELPRETKNVGSESHHPSGLKWNLVGAKEPTKGRAIHNPALASAVEAEPSSRKQNGTLLASVTFARTTLSNRGNCTLSLLIFGEK